MEPPLLFGWGHQVQEQLCGRHARECDRQTSRIPPYSRNASSCSGRGRSSVEKSAKHLASFYMCRNLWTTAAFARWKDPLVHPKECPALVPPQREEREEHR
eukprot:scaffold264_cov317-Pinguiococcus_pyrenoidosus.AAC.32